MQSVRQWMLLSLKGEGDPDTGRSVDDPRGRDAQRSNPVSQGRVLSDSPTGDPWRGLVHIPKGEVDGGPGAEAMGEGSKCLVGTECPFRKTNRF